MAEETQVLSIQQRIAALKQAQAGQSPDAAPSPFLKPTPLASRPAASRNQTVNNPPAYTYNTNSTRGNEPDAFRPPPPSTTQKPKVPPPLPARAPTLPPRRPSELSRKNSLESVASDASRSTSTSAGRTTGTSVTSVGSGATKAIRAPAWGATELPSLPPRKQENNNKPAKPPPRPKPSPANSSRSVSQSRPPLPTRRESTNSTSTNGDSTISRPPPPLSSRATTENPPIPNGARKLPPPLPSTTALEKIQESGFGAINRNAETPERGIAQESVPNGAPPPIPLASRPDLSKIQATKPRFNASSAPTAAVPSTICLKCRDFTGPDTHAARYPRQSLPTDDLGWLAHELTAPFPSPTDKARVIFTWLHHNIEYDVKAFFNNCVRPATPASTFSSGLAVCAGYAGLFTTLATHAGLESQVISGHGKGYGYDEPAPGAPVPPRKPQGHAWNVVKIDHGQWKLLDACWGAGSVSGAGRPYEKNFTSAMFTNSNDEFGLRHFPSNRAQFYRDDGRPEISWEEYILGNPNSPLCAKQPTIYGDAKKHSIGERSFRPAAKQVAVSQSGPVRFQFGLVCEHWTLEHHSRGAKPGLFLLMVHGVDGRQDDRLPLAPVRGADPGGGGTWWYVDVPNARTLGAPGQKVQLAVLTTFGDLKDARGVTAEEYRRQVGRVGMSWAYVAEWELV
ncbi:hypothetical protein FE257_011730 [Aspergillus nanangensis]|uniref:Transglutaminase-like domain-containing protein n=1 Tax=Aspergillus nanangensis TaxID=2582783 RepID=A0AAD4CV53_ASPNN|nr:hypothetical protein FE257_011730 [Aspergillus nanangensis]